MCPSDTARRIRLQLCFKKPKTGIKTETVQPLMRLHRDIYKRTYKAAEKQLFYFMTFLN